MVVPIIDQMPPAPVRTQAGPTYAAVADTFAAAMVARVPQINTSLAWVNSQASLIDGYRQTTLGYRDAAAQSAADADADRQAAQAAVTAAEQAGATQVALAVTARIEAEAFAQAAGAAIGIPGGRVPFSVLQINSAGAVSWGYGLPDRAAAQAGHSLILGAGKIPTWGFAGDQIGDLLSTARSPGALYLPANGTVYLQSAYPALFALVGLLGNPAGSVWTYTSMAATPYALGIDTDGNGVWVRGKKRSTDNGVTWTDIGGTYGATLDYCRAITYGGNGVWMAATEAVILRSLDNGVTWAISLNSVGAAESPQLVTDGNGTWIYIGYSSVVRISKDNGVTWGSSIGPAIGNPQGVCYIGNNTWITSTGYRSVNGAVNWSLYGSPAGSPVSNAAMKYLGNNIILIMSSGSTLRSVDGGFSWKNVGAIGYSNAGCSISHDGKGGLVMVGGSSYLLSSDYGISWQILAQPSGAGSMAYGSYGQGKFIVSTVNGYTSSIETFDYDKLTQFKTPNPVKIQGVTHYIKAKELA